MNKWQMPSQKELAFSSAESLLLSLVVVSAVVNHACINHSATDGFYEPTVLADADYSMEVMRDESFGPIVGIQRTGLSSRV